MAKKPMYLLTYDHGGYILWGPHFASSMQSAIEWMTKYPKFKIGLDNEAYCYDRYAEENPEIIELLHDVQKRFGDRFSIGSSSYGQPLAVFINEESNVRQMTYAVRSDLKHLNIRPYVYAISEHAYHSQIPQLALQAGYKMALMRTHFQMYGYNPTYDSAFGTWYGDDGSGIPTIPTYAGQGAHFGSTTMDNYIMTRWPREWDIPIEEFENSFPQIEPLLASRYDDVIQRCEELTQHVEEVENYHWVTLEDLFNIYAPYQDSKDEYRPGPNEFVVRMPWGYCGNKIFNDCRKGEVLVAQAERLSAMAHETGFAPDQNRLERAWKHLMISQHHDVQICGLLQDEKEFITECYMQGEAAKERALDWIAGQMKAVDGSSVLVVNPSDKPARGQISVRVGSRRAQANSAFEAVCGEEHIPCGYDVLERTANKANCVYLLRFNASVPPMSAKVYELRRRDSDASCPVSSRYEGRTLTTEYYEIVLGSGGICSVKDRRTGATLLQNPGEGRLFAGVINDIPAESHGSWSVQCRPMLTEALFQGEVGGIPCRFTLTCKEGDELLHCHAEFLHRGEDIGYGRTFEAFRDNTNGFVHEEKLRFVMGIPFQGEVSGLRDRPFLVAATDDTYVEGNYWAAVGNDTLAMAVFNRGSMCVTRETDCLSVPLAYANTYAWGEKRLWGEYSHDFALRPMSGGFDAEQLHREAVAYTYPLISRLLTAEQDGAVQQQFLPIQTSENVLMSAFYPENGKQLVRVYEFAGKPGNVSIPGYRLTKTDLFGEPAAPATDCLHLRPHEICSFQAERI